MHRLWDWALDEKVVLGFLCVVFAFMSLILIKWNVDKEFIGMFMGLASGFAGALTRGITHITADKEGTKQ